MEYRFVIFGKIIHTDFFIKLLNEYGFQKPLVIVSLDEEYYRDERLLEPYGLYSHLEELAEDGLCYLYKMNTINNDEAMTLFDQYNVNAAISINCRNIIKKGVIDYFDELIFNLHDSYLPNERGGALNTWRILNGINEVGNTLHYLEEGIDTGPIVAQTKTTITKQQPETIDYLMAEKINCEKVLLAFINVIRSNKSITAIKQDNDKSYYYPRLYTEVNGIINWDWDIYSIEKFIRAFSSPYPGAYTYFCEKKIHILKCRIELENEGTFHPFTNGKIVTVLDNNYVRVIAGCKSLVIEKISIDGKIVPPGSVLTIKHNLFSPEDKLIYAKNHVPSTLSMNKSEKKYNE